MLCGNLSHMNLILEQQPRRVSRETTARSCFLRDQSRGQRHEPMCQRRSGWTIVQRLNHSSEL